MLIKKNDYIAAILLVMSAIYCQSIYAVVADPRPKTFVQPDGSTITVKLRGDEHSHFYLTDDDYLLSRKGDIFYYANIDASGRIVASQLLAKPAAKRSAADKAYLSTVNMPQVFEKLSERATSNRQNKAPNRGPGLFEGTQFPSKGTQKVMVVLVEYQNLSFTLSDPYDYFNRMLNEKGFSDDDATGSCFDYFNDNSNGQFTPEFDLYGPIVLSKNMSYYGGNDWFGNDNHPEEMVIEACQQLDDTVDFTQYDRDHDGYIDNVYVIYAGKGEASYGSDDTVWPHSWSLEEATSTAYYFDGVRLSHYACSNEWENGRPDGIGTFVHEFSHVLGIPDLYATSYTSAFTPGNWSVMDHGNYNNDARTPPAYSAFERYALDWINPIELNGPNNISLKYIGTSNKCCIVRTDSPDEYFLFENRQQTGWDEYIPGHGMLVWHIDYSPYVWSSNTVNNSASHQYVDIEEADNTQTEYSRAGDSFPGTEGITEFTDDTKPSMLTWAKRRLETPITEITETNGVISFKVCGGLPDVDPVTLSEATDITPTSYSISWSADSAATEYHVSVYTKIQYGDRVTTRFVDGWNHTNVGDTTTTVVTGLEPETTYYCVVYASNGVFESEASNEVAVTTAPPTFDLVTPTVLDATEVNANWFTANWLAIDDATDYRLNVYTKVREGDPQYDSCDFTGGTSALPTGWSTSTKQTFANSAYSGEAIPALRISSDGAYVSSPTYADDICSVSFWHRGSNTSERNTLRVMAMIGNSYTEIASVTVRNAAGGVFTTIDNIPAGVRNLRIVYNEAEHKGSVAVDDITIGWGRDLVSKPFAGYQSILTGNVNSYLVEGTDRLTTYYYTVTGINGTEATRLSAEMSVTTAAENAAIHDITVSSLAISGKSVLIDAAAGTQVTVTDLMGRTVAAGKVGADGKLQINLSAHGVYVVRIADKASKIII